MIPYPIQGLKKATITSSQPYAMFLRRVLGSFARVPVHAPLSILPRVLAKTHTHMHINTGRRTDTILQQAYDYYYHY